MLIIDVQENLAANQQSAGREEEDGTASDLVADKDAVVYSILTRQGTPQVEKGVEVKKGDLLVEGKNPVMDDNGEVASYQYCVSDADILGVTEYDYNERFALWHEVKKFSGEESSAYGVRLFDKLGMLPHTHKFSDYDVVTDEHNLKIGDTFYLPLAFRKETYKEYRLEKEKYGEGEAKKLAEENLAEFCKKKKKKGVQIIENNVMIVTDGKSCTASGSIKVIEPIGKRKETAVTDIPQEGQMEDESDGNRD